ncbi:MAG TPA: glycosyltransferase [Ktedonobacterales bacterium]
MSRVQTRPVPFTTPEQRGQTKDRVASDHLRILFVTCTPSDLRTQERLRLLSRSLREDGHAILACVPRGTLSPEDAAEADGAGVEYIFLRQHAGAFTSALGSWATLLKRFRPNLVHLSADLPPSFALRLATITQLRARRRIPVLVEIDARIARMMTDASTASGWNAETRQRTTLYRKRATQLLCSDDQTLLWCTKMLDIPAFRLSLTKHGSLTVGEGQGQPKVLVTEQQKSSSQPDVAALVELLLPLLLGSDPLQIIVPVSMRRHLERSLANASSEVRGRLAYTKSFADWLSYLGDSRAVLGVINDPVSGRAIGAARACGVPVILVMPHGSAQPPVHVDTTNGIDGILFVHKGHPQELIGALRFIEANRHAIMWPEHPSASLRDIEAEVEHLRRIYEGVHLRERKQ